MQANGKHSACIEMLWNADRHMTDNMAGSVRWTWVPILKLLNTTNSWVNCCVVLSQWQNNQYVSSKQLLGTILEQGSHFCVDNNYKLLGSGFREGYHGFNPKLKAEQGFELLAQCQVGKPTQHGEMLLHIARGFPIDKQSAAVQDPSLGHMSKVISSRGSLNQGLQSFPLPMRISFGAKIRNLFSLPSSLFKPWTVEHWPAEETNADKSLTTMMEQLPVVEADMDNITATVV